jgi:hypothetical protein
MVAVGSYRRIGGRHRVLPLVADSSPLGWSCGPEDIGDFVAPDQAGAFVNDFNNLGGRIVAALGEPAARELLDVLTRSDADRAALIGRLHLREDASWLTELLIDIESDPDDITRVELIRALLAVVS